MEKKSRFANLWLLAGLWVGAAIILHAIDLVWVAKNGSNHDTFIANIIQAFYVLVTIVLAWYTYHLFRIASNAALDSRIKNRVDLLPLLGIEKVRLVPNGPITGDVRPSDVVLEFDVRNYGDGPARDVIVELSVRPYEGLTGESRAKIEGQINSFRAKKFSDGDIVMSGNATAAHGFIGAKSHVIERFPLDLVPGADFIDVPTESSQVRLVVSLVYFDLYGDLISSREAINLALATIDAKLLSDRYRYLCEVERTELDLPDWLDLERSSNYASERARAELYLREGAFRFTTPSIESLVDSQQRNAFGLPDHS